MKYYCLPTYLLFSIITAIFCITLFTIPYHLRHKPVFNTGILFSVYKNGSGVPGSTSQFDNFDELINITCAQWNKYNLNSQDTTRIFIALRYLGGLDNNYSNVYIFNTINFIIYIIILSYIFGITLLDKRIPKICVFITMVALLAALCNNYLSTTSDARMNNFFNHDRYDTEGSVDIIKNNMTDGRYYFHDQFEMLNALYFIHKSNGPSKTYFVFDKCAQINSLDTNYILRICFLTFTLFMIIITQAVITYRMYTDLELNDSYHKPFSYNTFNSEYDYDRVVM